MTIILKCERCDAISNCDHTGFIRTYECDRKKILDFCGWDCLLKFAAKIDVPEEFDA